GPLLAQRVAPAAVLSLLGRHPEPLLLARGRRRAAIAHPQRRGLLPLALERAEELRPRGGVRVLGARGQRDHPRQARDRRGHDQAVAFHRFLPPPALWAVGCVFEGGQPGPPRQPPVTPDLRAGLPAVNPAATP